MKLLLDKDGNVVVKDDKPVYVHDDGEEVPFDAPAAMAKISELNNESRDRRHKLREAEKTLKGFEGLDPVKAREALDTLASLEGKELLDKEKVEELKDKIKLAYDEREAEIVKKYESDKAEHDQALIDKDTTIRKLMIDGQFATSPTITEKTILVPEMAANYFGKNFRVENYEDNIRVIGYLNGEKIYSKEKPGEPAGFEEALKVIIDKYPRKDQILSDSRGGAGSQGGVGRRNGISVDDQTKMSPSELLKYAIKKNHAQTSQ